MITFDATKKRYIFKDIVIALYLILEVKYNHKASKAITFILKKIVMINILRDKSDVEKKYGIIRI